MKTDTFSKRPLFCLVLISLLAASTLCCQPLIAQENSEQVVQEFRTWTSSNGKFTFEAKLISDDNGQLVLEGKDGSTKNLKPEQLSANDREYLKSLKSKATITKEQKEKLKEMGLKFSRDEFSLVDEKKLKSEISDSLKQKKSIIDLAMQVEQIRLAQLQAENEIVLLKQANIQLNAQLVNASSVIENNKIVGLLDANNSKIDLAYKQIKNLGEKLKEGQVYTNKTREEFIDDVMSVRKFSDSLDEKMESMKANEDFQAIKAEIEATIKRSAKPFAETKSLARLRKSLAKLEEGVLSDSIPLRDDGSGTFKATVTINGESPIELVVDSGASVVTLPQKMADQLNIVVGTDAQPVTMTIADGSKISGKMITLETVRLGKFTAKNVKCAVLGPEATNAPNLLGMSFLGNFKFELDAAKGELKMMTVETGE